MYNLLYVVCKALNRKPGKIKIRKFADQEIGVEVQENVRGCDVFICQSLCTPVNDHLVELLLIIDAMKRASARVCVY